MNELDYILSDRHSIEDIKMGDVRVPRITCPMINRVNDALGGIETTCELVRNYDDDIDEFASDVLWELSDAKDYMESLRHDNERLRELGKYWREAHRNLERVVYEVHGRIKNELVTKNLG